MTTQVAGQRICYLHAAMDAAVERVLQRFEEPAIGNDGEKYTVYLHGRSRPGDTWQGWLVFERHRDGERFETAVETTQPDEEGVIYWASGLSAAYFEGALRRALRGPHAQEHVASPAAPLIGRGVDHETLEHRRALIQQEILALFRRAGERRMLTRDVFSALPYGHADVVRAIDDLERTQRTVIRRTEEGNDWLFLTHS